MSRQYDGVDVAEDLRASASSAGNTSRSTDTGGPTGIFSMNSRRNT